MDCAACADFISWLHHFEREYASGVVVLAALVTAAATALNVVIYWRIGVRMDRQIRLADDQIKLTRDIFESTTRPVVGIDMERQHEQALVCSFRCLLKNYGTSSALNLVFDQRITVGNSPPIFDHVDNITLHPRQTYPHSHREITRPSPSTLIEVQVGIRYQGTGRRVYSQLNTYRWEANKPIELIASTTTSVT